MSKSIKAIFAGSFDPVTNGHVDRGKNEFNKRGHLSY